MSDKRFEFPASRLHAMYPLAELGYTDFTCYYPATLRMLRSNSILFFKELTREHVEVLRRHRECVVIVPASADAAMVGSLEGHAVVRATSPRLEFARVLDSAVRSSPFIGRYRTTPEGATVGESTRIGRNVVIEPGAFIDENVILGDETIVCAGAVIRRFTSIGRSCVVREHAVIAGSGFGFERDEEGIPIRLPHLGGVHIGDFVEIGALTTVAAGTIDPTIVDDYAKIDDHVHVAHNCVVGRASIVTACAELSGGVLVGPFGWIGPNSSVLQKIVIGEWAVIGIGAVVTKPVDARAVVAGNPADLTTRQKTFARVRERLIAEMDAR